MGSAVLFSRLSRRRTTHPNNTTKRTTISPSLTCRVDRALFRPHQVHIVRVLSDSPNQRVSGISPLTPELRPPHPLAFSE